MRQGFDHAMMGLCFRCWFPHLLKSTEKIINTATYCFFQQGYSGANITGISRHAGISRVTIHKQFSSKKELFRGVVINHFAKSKPCIIEYSTSRGDFWQETEVLLLKRCEGVFDGISSALIRSELIHCGQAYCKDIIDAAELEEVNFIEKRLLEELHQQRITLTNLNINAHDFARLIEAIPKGIAVSSFETESQSFISHTLRLFKAATELT